MKLQMPLIFPAACLARVLPIATLAIVAAITTLAGCKAVGPDYQRRELPAPAVWHAPALGHGGDTTALATPALPNPTLYDVAYGPQMFRLTDRRETGFALAPTAEEVITTVAASFPR